MNDAPQDSVNHKHGLQHSSTTCPAKFTLFWLSPCASTADGTVLPQPAPPKRLLRSRRAGLEEKQERGLDPQQLRLCSGPRQITDFLIF